MRNSLPYIERSSGIRYTDPNRVKGVTITTVPVNTFKSGYGSKIPTRYMIDYLGMGMVKRRYRVYVMNYGNSGSAYINVGGNVVFLDSDTEHRLEKERDNVLAR